jgi:CubicO group peptidase (beta-lactamase class C family)
MSRWLSTLALSLFALTAIAQERTDSTAVAKALSDYVAQHKVVGAAVAIMKQNQSAFFGAGLADREKGVAVDQNTLFRLGSISKPVTAIAALQLVQEGKLSLFANVAMYAPEWTKVDAPITLRHLLTHTSGIRHYIAAKRDVYYERMSVAKSLDVFKDDPLLFQPGERVSYSTHAFSLVARVVETAGAQDFATAIRSRIAEKSGATTLALEDRAVENPARSQIYAIRADEESLLEARAEDISWKSGGGGMEASAPDLARFGFAAMTGKLLDKQMTDFMFQPQTVGALDTKRGLGWDFSPFGQPEHGGAQQGCRCLMVLDREHGTVYVVMTNTGGSHPIGQLMMAVINAWGERKVGN